ncbi:MAG: hypothetical protein IT370_17410 [Deltaproteobacteria bacterium]|nr:hypothetical protein [Deltaproteobacteria bacterium]
MRRVGLLLLLAVLAAASCKKKSKGGGPGAGPGTPGVGLTDGGAGATARGLDAGAAVVVDAAAPAPVIDAGPSIDATPPTVTGDAGLAGSFDGRPGVLVISDDFDRHQRGIARVADLAAQGIPATVVQSRLFGNLRPGFFIVVVGRFDDEASAIARADELRPQIPKVRVKKSGPITGGPDPGVADAGMPSRTPGQTLPRLVHVTGKASHEGTDNVTLHITMPDGRFDTRPNDADEYEFWAATTGDIEIEMTERGAEKFPPPCTGPGPQHFWAGGHSASATIENNTPSEIRLDDIVVWLESNPCD